MSSKCALTARSTDPPVRAFYLASIGGGGPVNLVSLGLWSTYGKYRIAARNRCFPH
jgi:hypothetical protein